MAQMEKITLENLIEKGYTYKKIAEELELGNSTIGYWLKKYKLKTKNKKHNTKIENGIRKCLICKCDKAEDEFYKRRKSNSTSYCKKCSNNYHTERLKRIKIKMINYKGGECTRCHLKLEECNYFVFDFHHLNPSEKDPNFSKIKFQNWDKIEKELNKCILVCSNCHRTIHFLERALMA